MPLTSLKEIIDLKSRPETTLSLERALQEGVKTVSTYRFTPSIKGYFHEILEMAASERGQGYWIAAEYGAGKTHLLGTLGALLTDQTGQIWDAVSDSDIKDFKTALSDKTRLLPVVLNCKGGLKTEGGDDSLLRLLERSVRAALDQAGLQGKATISTANEIREWWEKRASQGVRADLAKRIQSQFRDNPMPEDLLDKKGEEVFAKAIIDAARALNIEIPLSRDVRTRFQHIYQQLTSRLDYHGMLFIIDEFKSWQDLHPDGSSGFAEAEHVLETLAFHLPVDDRARIITIIASQSSPPRKLSGGASGDRFRTFPLFAKEGTEREYDEIVAFRVRELKSDRMPEIDQYYNHYFQKFRFLSQTKKEYFRQTFPFQPRCFDTIRNITQGLATARSSIHYVYEVLSNKDALERRGLIKVCDLMQSENLVKDLQTATYKDAYQSYQFAMQSLPTLFDEESDRQMAEDVLKTLFLTYCASSGSPRGLTASELAEACLATDEVLTSDDLIHGIILPRLKELSQVEYTNKEKGAFFRVSQVSGPTYTQILANAQRGVDNDSEAGPEWRKLLIAASQETGGVAMLFAGQTLDRPDKTTGRTGRVRYDGERVVIREWSKSLGVPVVDKSNYGLHFKLVYLLEPVEPQPEDLLDDRIAVIIPAPWKDVALEEMRRYCAVLRVENEYTQQQGPEAEEVRQLNRSKKRELLEEIKRKQVEAYQRGRIVTKAGLGIDPKQVFASPDKADDAVASALLSHSYRQQPFDHDAFKKELTSTEPGRLFAALFQDSTASADKSALENFGVGLGLSSKSRPMELDPEHCQFFDILRQELEQVSGDLRLYSFYEKYTGAPWGVPVDLLSLYLAAFVRHARPQCYVSVKPEAGLALSTGRALRDNRFGYNDVPQLTWTRNKLHRSFERLVQESGPGWNDFIEYFRELDNTLKATESPQETAAQQERLRKAQADWRSKLVGIKSRLSPLAERMGENISQHLAALDSIVAICAVDTQHLPIFADALEEQFEKDLKKYKHAFEIVRKIEELDRTHLASLAEAFSYLEQIESDARIADDLSRAKSAFSLNAFCSDPSFANEALQRFNQLRERYISIYQAHYRDYRTEMIALHEELEKLHAVIDGLKNINGVEDLGKAIEPLVIRRHQELLKRTDASHLQPRLPDVEKRPVANNVRLETRAPAGDVEAFKSDLELAEMRGLDLLAPPAILDVLTAAGDAEINQLAAAARNGEHEQVARLFTKSVAAKVKELLRQAKMVVVEISLSDCGPVQIGDSADDLAGAVSHFEKFLKGRISEARKNNPGKIVRLNLK
jgi:hypothetical protein